MCHYLSGRATTYTYYIRGNYKQIYVFTCNILIFLAIMFYALARGSILVCARVNNVLVDNNVE